MGFGYHEASTSGVTKFDTPPSSKDMNFHLHWRAKEKELLEVVRKDPSIGPVVREIIAAQTVAGWWSVDFILWELRLRNLIP
jgi:hypothetical protein